MTEAAKSAERERIAALVLQSMADRADPCIYGSKHALKINEGRADKCADAILSLRSSSDPDAVRALEVDPALAKVLTYNAAYTLEIRRNVIEECAQAVINAIPLLPMGRVDASEVCDAVQDEAVRAVRALKDATPGSHFPAGSIGEWPSGCHDPESCYRHQDCMYLNCAWRGKHTVRSLPASPSLTEKRPPSNKEGGK